MIVTMSVEIASSTRNCLPMVLHAPMGRFTSRSMVFHVRQAEALTSVANSPGLAG